MQHFMGHESAQGTEEEQSLKLALRQPRIWSASDFIFLALAYVLSLTVSPSHWQCTVSVLIIVE